jgi:hypothetical protein
MHSGTESTRYTFGVCSTAHQCIFWHRDVRKGRLNYLQRRPSTPRQNQLDWLQDGFRWPLLVKSFSRGRICNPMAEIFSKRISGPKTVVFAQFQGIFLVQTRIWFLNRAMFFPLFERRSLIRSRRFIRSAGIMD